jgi:hypothetical protein
MRARIPPNPGKMRSRDSPYRQTIHHGGTEARRKMGSHNFHLTVICDGGEGGATPVFALQRFCLALYLRASVVKEFCTAQRQNWLTKTVTPTRDGIGREGRQSAEMGVVAG